MHSKIWQFSLILNSLALHGWGHHIGHVGRLFGQVCRKVHLFPAIFLLLGHPRKPEVRAHSRPFHEVYHPIYVICTFTHWILINWRWMGFKVKFNKTIFRAVCVNIFQNKGVLVSLEPSILPIETVGFSCWEGFVLVAFVGRFGLNCPQFHYCSIYKTLQIKTRRW